MFNLFYQKSSFFAGGLCHAVALAKLAFALASFGGAKAEAGGFASRSALLETFNA
ncbi:MAG: hypothetical protein Q8P07_03175 [bacterium]|nr:hypothetical protein [bacterium]